MTRLGSHQRRTAVLLSISMILPTLLVYGVGRWYSKEYAPVFWYLFLLPVGIAAYTHGLRLGLGLSILSTALLVPIGARHLAEQGISPFVISLGVAILIINGEAVLIGYLGGSQRRQRDLYRTLNELGERFSRELKLDELLKVILDRAMAELNASMGEILLWNESACPLWH